MDGVASSVPGACQMLGPSRGGSVSFPQEAPVSLLCHQYDGGVDGGSRCFHDQLELMDPYLHLPATVNQDPALGVLLP